MTFKKILNFSPNFNLKKRSKSQIKFLVFHYTGMKSEIAALKKLTNIQSEVSSHYLIKNNGEIVLMVPETYIAWHAGVSFWKKYKSINKYSIGIEISNPGHSYNYKNFSTKQIKSIVKLSKYLIKKYNIKPTSILGHSDIAPNRKKDPGEKFPWKTLSKVNLAYWHSLDENKLKKNRLIRLKLVEQNEFFTNLYKFGYNRINSSKLSYTKRLLIKSFQRRFRQNLVNGIVDKECLFISRKLF